MGLEQSPSNIETGLSPEELAIFNEISEEALDEIIGKQFSILNHENGSFDTITVVRLMDNNTVSIKVPDSNNSRITTLGSIFKSDEGTAILRKIFSDKKIPLEYHKKLEREFGAIGA